MAALRVTPEALACIRAQIEREHMRDPLVAVLWMDGQVDLRRTPDGRAVWDRETPCWKVTAIDLAPVAEAGGRPPQPNAQIAGYRFLLVGKSSNPQLDGCTLGCDGGELVVVEGAT